jgi:DNA-binding GntR family transcriptional regulator
MTARAKKRASSSRQRFTAMYEEIRERICLLRYPPGMHLGEEALAAEFGVSRTPIRRVLTFLEADGLVESRHGVGTVVTDIDIDKLREIYALRMRLAEMIGDLNPRLRTPADLERLRTLLARCDELRECPDSAGYNRLNMAFARELTGIIGNSALREVTERLYYQAFRFFLASTARMDMREEVEIFRREMAETIAVLERGDMRAVGLIRRRHIEASFHRMTTREAARQSVEPGEGAATVVPLPT